MQCYTTYHAYNPLLMPAITTTTTTTSTSTTTRTATNTLAQPSPHHHSNQNTSTATSNSNTSNTTTTPTPSPPPPRKAMCPQEELLRLQTIHGPHSILVAEQYNSMGLHQYHGAGNPRSALFYHVEALRIYDWNRCCALAVEREREEHEQELSTMSSSSQQSLQALQTLAQSPPSSPPSESRAFAVEMAITLSDIGNVLRQMNDFVGSATAYKECLDLFLVGLLQNGMEIQNKFNAIVEQFKLKKMQEQKEQRARVGHRQLMGTTATTSSMGLLGGMEGLVGAMGGGGHASSSCYYNGSTTTTSAAIAAELQQTQEQSDQQHIFHLLETQQNINRKQVGAILARHPGYRAAVRGISILLRDIPLAKFVTSLNAGSSRVRDNNNNDHNNNNGGNNRRRRRRPPEEVLKSTDAALANCEGRGSGGVSGLGLGLGGALGATPNMDGDSITSLLGGFASLNCSPSIMDSNTSSTAAAAAAASMSQCPLAPNASPTCVAFDLQHHHNHQHQHNEHQHQTNNDGLKSTTSSSKEELFELTDRCGTSRPSILSSQNNNDSAAAAALSPHHYSYEGLAPLEKSLRLALNRFPGVAAILG